MKKPGLTNHVKKDHRLEPDKPDARDHVYEIPEPHHGKALPSSVDLRHHCPPVYNQESTDSCTAHAVSGAYACHRRQTKARHFKPSPRFIYYNERELTNQLQGDCVVHLRDALKAVAKRGVCPAHLWRFSNSERLTGRKPPQRAFAAARNHRIVSYLRIGGTKHKPADLLTRLKHCLADGHTFVFAFAIYPNFRHGWEKWKHGIMPMPGPRTAKKIEHHAVLAVGYDDELQAFLVRNSWGPKFGTGGYFRMPYSVITNPSYAYDFWTVRGVTG